MQRRGWRSQEIHQIHKLWSPLPEPSHPARGSPESPRQTGSTTQPPCASGKIQRTSSILNLSSSSNPLSAHTPWILSGNEGHGHNKWSSYPCARQCNPHISRRYAAGLSMQWQSLSRSCPASPRSRPHIPGRTAPQRPSAAKPWYTALRAGNYPPGISPHSPFSGTSLNTGTWSLSRHPYQTWEHSDPRPESPAFPCCAPWPGRGWDCRYWRTVF